MSASKPDGPATGDRVVGTLGTSHGRATVLGRGVLGPPAVPPPDLGVTDLLGCPVTWPSPEIADDAGEPFYADECMVAGEADFAAAARAAGLGTVAVAPALNRRIKAWWLAHLTPAEFNAYRADVIAFARTIDPAEADRLAARTPERTPDQPPEAP